MNVPPTTEQPFWRPRPPVPPLKLEEGPTTQIPLVGPARYRATASHWVLIPGSGLVAGLLVAAAVVFGLQVGEMLSPEPPAAGSCGTP